MAKHQEIQPHDEILDEAYHWVLTFNGDTPASNEDVRALNDWAKRSPAHRAALEEAEAFWCEAEMLSALAVPLQSKSTGGVGRFFSALAGMASSLMPVSRAGLAAAMLVLGIGVTVTTLWLPNQGVVGNGLYQTAVGEQKALRLRDNSVLHLDTSSQIRIDYQDKARQIYLLQGKAHFEVAKNPDRPFEVFARDGLVRAVGTAFSVYLTPQEVVEVIVDEGRVDLARLDAANASPVGIDPPNTTPNPNAKQAAPDATAMPTRAQQQVFLSLDRGQGARFDRVQHELAQLDDQALAQQLAWRDGVLVFVRDPLHEVVAEVSRYTHTTIDIADPTLAGLVLGGRFRVGELDALFEVLEVGFGVEVSYLSEHHVQLRRAER
jgi:transmembrane sensor